MGVSSKDYKVTGAPPADVKGQPPGTGLSSSDHERVSGDFKHGVDGGGSNAGSHPAKSQPSKMNYF